MLIGENMANVAHFLYFCLIKLDTYIEYERELKIKTYKQTILISAKSGQQLHKIAHFMR